MNTQSTEIETLLSEIFNLLETQYENDNIENESTTKHPIPANNFGSLIIIERAKSITDHEASLLQKTAISRENALDLLRQNKLKEGSAALLHTSQLIENVKLEREASLIYSSYHSAAESFLSIKNKDYESALTQMKNALITHEELFLDFGHAIEARRIHLARNISKIISILDKEKAFELTLQLLEYSITGQAKWPLDICNLEKPDIVSMRTKIFTINQLLIDVNGVLSKNPSQESKTKLDNFIKGLSQNTNADTKIILYWVSAYQAILHGDEISFLKNALLYFAENNPNLPDANHCMLSLLGDNFLGKN